MYTSHNVFLSVNKYDEEKKKDENFLLTQSAEVMKFIGNMIKPIKIFEIKYNRV
jgi:hypothetical protein